MSQSNCTRNSFLKKSCKNFPCRILEDNLNDLFFHHFEDPDKQQQFKTINRLKQYEENAQFGYGDVGFQILIENLSSDDPKLIAKTIKLLCDELKNPIKIASALKHHILDSLTILLNVVGDGIEPSFDQKLLMLLHILSFNFDAAMSMVTSKAFITSLVRRLISNKESDKFAFKIFTSLSSNPAVADKLLLLNGNFSTEVKHLVVNSKTGDVLELLANLISRESDTFLTPDVFKALHQRLMNGDDRVNALKCLAMLINSSQGLSMAQDSDLISTVVSILLNETNDEEVTTYGIMALKYCMLSAIPFSNSMFPSKSLLKILMQKTRSKQNFLLQENSIQALRIMSDNPAIKNELREVFRDKISEISCISEESKRLKDDLMQWLNYRNYEKNEPSKYSKLFI